MSFFLLAKIIQPGMFLFFLALLIPGAIAYMLAFANAISPRKRLHQLHNPHGDADHGHGHGGHHEEHHTHHEEHTTHHEEHTTKHDHDGQSHDEHNKH